MCIRNTVAARAAFIAVLNLAPIGSAGAGLNDQQSNTFIVEKDVAGPVPESAVFEVEVTCEQVLFTVPDAAPRGETGPVTLHFDATGAPIGPNMVMAPPDYQCTASETVTNDAAATYACTTSAPAGATPEVNGDFEPVKCINDQTVLFDDVIGAEGTITVTNTFEEEPPPPAVEPAAAAPAAVVAATPAFTG